MVRADPKRNYYADLEVSSTADTEEIKKQFRMLAKLYHPDRNRGHEVEFVDKFQAIQAANEILSDPTERAKYDTARAKILSRASAPPPPKADPYGFSRNSAGSTWAQNTGPQSTPQPKPKPRPTFNTQAREHPSSAGAEKVAAFARGQPPQTWTRERFEEAARAEAAKGFSTMRSQVPPPQPPRPPRQHPTAPRPASATTGLEPQYSQNVPFPGMARTASRRKQAYPEDAQQRSAFQYVRAGRPPPATQPHAAEAYTPLSPQQVRTAASPLRHTRSTEYSAKPERPGLYPRADGRYSSNTGERTDIHGTNLGRSASVRNSPIDPIYEEHGPFGRSRTQHDPSPRKHHSASPKLRATSFSSSDSSGDEPVHMPQTRRKAMPKSPRVNTNLRPNPGLEAPFPNTSYTRVVDEDQSYVYPPPAPKQPVRNPFPNMTSPDEPPAPDNAPFSNTESKNPKHEDVFRPANFSHQNWAERLQSTSPVKRGLKSKKPPPSKSDYSPDAMDVDPSDNSGAEKARSNGIDLNELKNEAPFKNEGLNGVDDLKHDLPWESQASTHVRTGSRQQGSRLRTSDYPRPPKPINPPALDRLNDENWKNYLQAVNDYLTRWNVFHGRMIEHFRLRQEKLKSCMNENWVSMPSDGPPAEQVAGMNGSENNGAGGLKAGYAAYMEWLRDDEMCRAWWNRACEMHKGVMEDLGQVRDSIMGVPQTV